MKYTILYFSMMSFEQECIASLKNLGKLVTVEKPSQINKSILRDVNILFAPLGYYFGSDIFDGAPNLKIIASNTTGIPHIDQKEARKRQIKICALHDQQKFLETITPTAEHTIGLLLSGWRKIPWAHQDVLSGRWNRWNWGAPKMLSRCSIGIIGFGRIGRRVAKIARALGMSVRWFDPHVKGGERNLLNLAKKSDFLSIHAVANEDTRFLVSRNILNALPKGAMVLNTARSEILDTNALLDLLESGHLGFAALDTIDNEYDENFNPSKTSKRLISYAKANDNLILTPHIGGSTHDAWRLTQMHVVKLVEKAINSYA